MVAYHPNTPAGMLMWEHRLILRMLADMDATAAAVAAGTPLPPDYVAGAVDFIRSYADRCHHGKEEDILFRDLGARDLAREDADTMAELIEEHVWARRATGRLVDAEARRQGGDPEAVDEVLGTIGELVEFYPAHIEKEDHHFFKPALSYFSAEERKAMADEFGEFDRMLIHERYVTIVEGMEARRK